MIIQEILTALPTLTKAERAFVKHAIDVLDGGAESSPEKGDKNVELLYQCLQTFFKSAGLGSVPPPRVLNKLYEGRLLPYVTQQLDEILLSTGKQYSRTTRMSFYKDMLGFAVKRLRKRRREASVREVMFMLLDARALLDAEFPGYAASGLLHLAVGGHREI